MDKVWIALASFLAGVFFQQYRAARSEEGAVINEHIKDIEKFSEAAQSYWLRTPKDSEEEAFLSAKVRVTHAATTALYEVISRICEPRHNEYQAGMQNLFKSATGGAFESARRSLDPERAMATADLATGVIHLLRVSRINLLSISYMYRAANWWFRDLWRDFGPKP